MKFKYISLLFLFLLIQKQYAQEAQSPSQFFHRPIASQFTSYWELQNFFNQLTNKSTCALKIPYGKSYEGRELFYILLGTAENINSWRDVQKSHLKSIENKKLNFLKSEKLILWYSYSIHGNEPVGSEVAMQWAYELVTKFEQASDPRLNETLVILDPCLNPDGRERYVGQYKQKVLRGGNPNPDHWDHFEDWPGGRYNHYHSDLNRDWLWQTQQESKVRVAAYLDWMPHMHFDFHETQLHTPYFFAPGAEPYHEMISTYQRSYQHKMGGDLSDEFDAKDWPYITGQIFDLYSPVFGDTWPIFHGAQGFTFERGGAAKAGLQIRYKNDTITLPARFEQHLAVSRTSFNNALKNKKQVIHEYRDYHASANIDNKFYKSFVVKNDDSYAFHELVSLLKRQGITPNFADESKPVNKAYSYREKKNINLEIEPNDLVLKTSQKLGRFISVLFEPKTYLSDSVTYDLTAWQLPYVFNLESYALKSNIELELRKDAKQKQTDLLEHKAFFCEWKGVESAKFLAALQQHNYKCFYNELDIKLRTKLIEQGSILFLPSRQDKEIDWSLIDSLHKKWHLSFHSLDTILLHKRNSPELKDAVVHYQKPEVAVLAGKGITASEFGDVWFYFEQELDYPLHILEIDYLDQVDLHKYDMLIVPTGNFDEMILPIKLSDFVRKGGKLVLIENAVQSIFGSNFTVLERGFKRYKIDLSREDRRNESLDMRRAVVSHSTGMAICKMKLDDRHPVSWGLGKEMYIFKKEKNILPRYKMNGFNVGTFENDFLLSGFMGNEIKQKIPSSLGIGVEMLDKGTIIMLSDSPLFRNITQDGKLLMANIVFFDF